MFDFCFTIPLGFVLLVRPLFGPEAIDIVIGGVIITCMGYLSLWSYNDGKLCRRYSVLSAGLVLALLTRQWQAMGVPTIIMLGLMAIFYVWQVFVFIPRNRETVAEKHRTQQEAKKLAKKTE